MIILISGATHTGKTATAQRLMEKYGFPYYSIDHFKMGLIRSGQTALSPNDDEKLTPYLWSIIREIIKTAIENKQNLIVEGCYIPFDFQEYFSKEQLKEIAFYCLVMSEHYIENNFDDIVGYENVIEQRLFGNTVCKAELIEENNRNLYECKKNNLNYILIDKTYDIKIEL